MRHILLCFSLFLSMLAGNTLEAQTISHRWQGATLSEVLSTISRESKEYRINFIHEQLDTIRVDAKVERMSVRDAIAKVTKGLPVKVKTRGQDIFIQYSRRQAMQKINLHGTVLDQRTHVHLIGATVQLLRRDSTVVAMKVADVATIYNATMNSDGTANGREEHTAEFTLKVPKVQEQYILAVSYVGYQTAYIDYTLNNLHKREVTRELPPIYLKQESHVLKNVDVVASKVMFFHRGDTIVYNADAFQLAEGSMLDALVRQLPGVEVRPNGQIYHNGKFVDNLLLNGKDFFRGHQDVMLNNLPSYTVKEIKVYDKYGDKSEFLGTRLDNDKEYVMEVQLKREYSIGWLGNAEVGMGTTDRYLARLLAIRFTDHSRIAVYANANNLNDQRKPGENDDWKPSDMNDGRLSQRMVGLDYNVEERDKTWKAEGNLQLRLSDHDTHSTTNQTNFLSTGDTQDRMEQDQRQKNIDLDTRHKMRMKFSRFDLSLSPTLNYQRYDHRSTLDAVTRSATADTLLNTQRLQGKNKGHETRADMNIASTIKLAHANEHLSVEVGVSATDKDDDRFSRYDIDYAAGRRLYSNQYLPNHPDRQWRVNPTIIYYRELSQTLNVQPIYMFTHQEQRRWQSLYQLDLADSLATQPFGWTPEEVELAQTLDRNNTYDSHLWLNQHEVRPTLFWTPKLWGGMASVGVHPSWVYESKRLNYQRASIDTTIIRHDSFFQLPMVYFTWASSDYKYTADFYYDYFVKSPDLTDLVNIHDTTDPMNIYEGSTALSNRHTQRGSLSVSHNLRERQRTQTLTIGYQTHRNAVAKGYVYNPETGVRTWRPYNVNGNWNGTLQYRLTLPLDKARRVMLTSTTEASGQHSVRMVGASTLPQAEASRATIDNRSMEQELRLTWKLGDHRLTWKADGLMRRVDSSRPDFGAFNAYDLTLGASALIQLPLKMQLSTDFTAYSRWGYTADEMNGTDLVWNARLTYPLAKGRLLLALDGFDILGQLSNVTRTVNAQSRTETRTNTLPRYALLHAIWRFNKQPKKKP